MKIEYYTVSRQGPAGEGLKWFRWRIRGELGAVIVQGQTWHRLRGDAQAEVNAVLEFLEAWSRERVQWGGV